MKTLAILSQKGGIGKTNTAVNLVVNAMEFQNGGYHTLHSALLITDF